MDMPLWTPLYFRHTGQCTLGQYWFSAGWTGPTWVAFPSMGLITDPTGADSLESGFLMEGNTLGRSAVQRQKAVSAYFISKQILYFGFAEQRCWAFPRIEIERYHKMVTKCRYGLMAIIDLVSFPLTEMHRVLSGFNHLHAHDST